MWLPDDRDKALWWLVHERERCPSCQHRAEETDPKQGGDPHAFEWTLRHCRTCEILAQGSDKLDKLRSRNEVRRGTTVTLRPTPPAEGGPRA